jgi:hypothetical protein
MYCIVGNIKTHYLKLWYPRNSQFQIIKWISTAERPKLSYIRVIFETVTVEDINVFIKIFRTASRILSASRGTNVVTLSTPPLGTATFQSFLPKLMQILDWTTFIFLSKFIQTLKRISYKYWKSLHICCYRRPWKYTHLRTPGLCIYVLTKVNAYILNIIYTHASGNICNVNTRTQYVLLLEKFV